MSEPEEVWIDGKRWEKHGETLSRLIEPEDLPALHAEEDAYFATWHKKISEEWASDSIQSLARQTVKLMEPKNSALVVELLGINLDAPLMVAEVSKKYNIATDLVQALKDYSFYLMIRVNRSNPLKEYVGDEASDDEHNYDFEAEGYEKLERLLKEEGDDFLPYFDGLLSKHFLDEIKYWHVNWGKYPDMLYELSSDSISEVNEYYATEEFIEDFLNGWLGWSETFLALMKYGFANYRGSRGDWIHYTNKDGSEETFPAGYPHIPRFEEDSWMPFRDFCINAMASITGINPIKMREMYMMANPAESIWLYFIPNEFRNLLHVDLLMSWAKGEEPLGEAAKEGFYDAIMARRYWRSWGTETEAMIGLPNIYTYISRLLYDMSGSQPFGDKYAD